MPETHPLIDPNHLQAPTVNTHKQWLAIFATVALAAGVPSVGLNAIFAQAVRPQLTDREVENVRQIAPLAEQVDEIADAVKAIQQTQQELTSALDLRRQTIDAQLSAIAAETDDRLRKTDLDAWTKTLYILNHGEVAVPDVYTKQPIGSGRATP